MTPVQVNQIAQKWPNLIYAIYGNSQVAFDNIATLEKANPTSLIFITNESQLSKAQDTTAAVVIIPHRISTERLGKNKTWILSLLPELTMRTIKNEYVLATPYRSAQAPHIHPSAIIDPTAHLESSVVVCAGAVIGANVQLAENVFVGANSVVEKNVKIGRDTTLHPLVYVGHSCEIGERCEVKPNSTIGAEGFGYAHDEKGQHFRIPHSGRVILENDVHVGSSCTLDRGTLEDSVIGAGTKIDNQCHLAHNSVLGKNGLITAQFGMAGSSKIGNNFIVGGKSSVTGHIEITDNVHIAGMSAVTKSIEKPGQYGGFPLQPLQDYLKTKAAMIHLPALRKQIQNFLKNESSS